MNFFFFFPYFLQLSRPGIAAACHSRPPTSPPTPSPRRGLAAESVPVVPAVPGPGAAFGNGRTHTGAVAGSGGSRLANYSPGEPLRTWAPGTHGCNRPPCASPSPLPGLCCWAGRVLVGVLLRPVWTGGGMRWVSVHMQYGGTVKVSPPHTPRRGSGIPGCLPGGGGAEQGPAGYRSLEQRSRVSPRDSGR